MNRLSPSHNKDLKTDYVTDFFKAKLKSFTCLFCGDVVYAKVWLFTFCVKGGAQQGDLQTVTEKERKLSLKGLRIF